MNLMLEQKPSIAQLVERWTVEVQIDIHRSLVQLRLEGIYSGSRFSICPKTKQPSYALLLIPT